MKLQKKLTQKILKFYALKLKFHEKKNFTNEDSLASYLKSIKKTLFLILQFHRTEKIILFVGLSPEVGDYITKFTNHVVINPSLDIKDFVSNGFCLYYLKRLKNLKWTNLKPDLVVVSAHNQKEMLIKECLRKKMPFISYDNATERFNINSSKNFILDNSKKIQDISFFELSLVFMIKKLFKYPAGYKQKVSKAKSLVNIKKNKKNYGVIDKQ